MLNCNRQVHDADRSHNLIYTFSPHYQYWKYKLAAYNKTRLKHQDDYSQ